MLKGQLVTMHVDQVRAFTLFGHLVEPSLDASLSLASEAVVQQQGFGGAVGSAVMA